MCMYNLELLVSGTCAYCTTRGPGKEHCLHSSFDSVVDLTMAEYCKQKAYRCIHTHRPFAEKVGNSEAHAHELVSRGKHF